MTAPRPHSPLIRGSSVEGDICDPETVAAAVEGIDTIFHTAAIIDLMGGASVTDEYRQRSFAVNVPAPRTSFTPRRPQA